MNRDLPQHRSKSLLIAGYGGLLFIGVYVTLGLIIPTYNSVQETISALELTPFGMAQQINFILFGSLSCLFAWALRRELESGWGVSIIPLFQALSGIAVIGDGFFVRPPLHMTCDLIAFNAALCVLFLFAWRVRHDPRWRGWAAGSILTAVAMMAFLFCFGMLNHLGGPAGLMEKLATAVRTLWTIVLVSRLLLGASLAPVSALETSAAPAHQ
ncbi:MAG TPA: DUF998 domain-containing protein [Terracidiphilus sp.]|nr:DUF998 domain-containing protein [Terracidiphilus sp.]